MAGKKGMKSGKPATVPVARVKPGDDLLPLVDGRARLVRGMRAKAREIYADLGGVENLSAMQRAMVHRFISIEMWQVSFEAQLVTGKKVESLLGTYLQSINTSLGLVRHLGLKRTAKSVPALRDYLRAKSKEVQDA